MAQKVITRLVDDIDGTDLADGGGETVMFALDGTSFEIDLSTKHAEQLRSALAKYTAAGRRVGRAPARSNKRSASGPAAAEVRDRARSNGHEVPDRGRIPAEVRKAFDER